MLSYSYTDTLKWIKSIQYIRLETFSLFILLLLSCNSSSFLSVTIPPLSVISFSSHLRLNISVVVVLEEQRRRLGVVFAGCNVQGREAHLAFGVVLQQQRDHRVVALLESNGKWSEAVLEEQRGGKTEGISIYEID